MKYLAQFIRNPENVNVLKEISDSGNLSTLVVFTTPTFPYWKFSSAGGNIKCVLRLMWASQISSAYLFLIFLPSSVSSLSPPRHCISASIKLSSNFAPKLTLHCPSDCREENCIYYLAPIFCSVQSSQFEKTNYSICKSSKPRKLMENEIRTDNEIFSFHIKTFHHQRSQQSPCSPSNFYIFQIVFSWHLLANKKE